MRVLRVISSVDLSNGGPINGLINSSAMLQKNGVEVHVASLDGCNYEVSKFPFKLFSFDAFTPARLSFDFRSWINSEIKNYDVIVIHGLWQMHGIFTAKACVEKNIPYVLFTHGMLDPWFDLNAPLKRLKKLIYWFAFERYTINRAERVLFTSEDEKVLARNNFPCYSANEYVISYGSPLPDYDLSVCSNLFKSRYPSLDNKRYFLFLSRVHPKKGVDLLIKAFARLKDCDHYLAIAGPVDDHYKKVLEEIINQCGIERRVVWLGMLKDELKWGAFNEADAFVLPSHQENFGIVVSEALSLGKVVLTTNKVNIWREILDSHAGYVANDDVEGVEDVLQGWLSTSPEEQRIMAKNAMQCYQTRFSIDAAVSDMEDVLRLAFNKKYGG